MIKLVEAHSLVEAGADELDMMINLRRLKSGELSYIRDEINAVVDIAPHPLQVILEVFRLTDDEIRRGSESVVEAEPRSSRPGPVGPVRHLRANTSGLSMLSCKQLSAQGIRRNSICH